MFSSQNFLLPVTTGDKVIKIRNVNGQLAHIVRDPTCTIRQEGVLLYIKQQSESLTLTLDFASSADAAAAHLLLRSALQQLGASAIPPNLTPPQEYSFNPATTTTLGEQYTVTLPIAATAVHGIYVNGVLVADQFCSVVLLISNESSFIWKSTAEYILEPSDLVTIKYH